MQHPHTFRLVCGVFALVSLACDDEADSESAALGDKLKSCDIVSEGEARPPVGGAQLARCNAQCLIDATCEELDAFYCMANPSDRVVECQAECLRPACDGGDTRYLLLQRCDGEAHCKDGADERDCPEREGPEFCEESGERITRLERCDGDDDCGDGTDERDCPPAPPAFTCKTTVLGFSQQIPESEVCDLVPNCLDGSDESEEQGCAKFSCN